MGQQIELDEHVLATYLQGRASTFADLYAFFDGDAKRLVQFLTVFQGREIKVPSMGRIQKWFLDIRCYQIVSKLGGEEWLCELAAQQLGQSPNRVKEGFLRVKIALKESTLPHLCSTNPNSNLELD